LYPWEVKDLEGVAMSSTEILLGRDLAREDDELDDCAPLEKKG
jgi:hypothetical protein